MRYVLLVGCVIALITLPAIAKEPVDDPGHESTVECPGLVDTCMVYDCTGTTETCDTQCGFPVWEVGCPEPRPVGMPTTDCYGNLLCDLGEDWNWMIGTAVSPGNLPWVAGYVDQAGERLILDTLDVAESCYLVEMCHWYDIETSYDGGNFEVNDGSGWTVVSPVGGYPDDEISDSPNYYACCVDGEPGFNGSSGGWVLDCWDLSSYMGSTVMIAVKFGSDESVTYPGWFIMPPVAGGAQSTPTEQSSWGQIKSMYH